MVRAGMILGIVLSLMLVVMPARGDVQNYPRDTIKYNLSPDGSVWQLAWHPTEDVLAVALDPTPEALRVTDQSIWLYTDDGQAITQISMPLQNNIKDMKWSPGGDYLAVVSYVAGVDSIYVINTTSISNPQLVPGFPVPHVNSRDVAWSPDGTQIAINWAAILEVWDVASGTKVLTHDVRPERSGISELAWSANNKLADAGDEEVYIWDMNAPSAPIAILPFDITGIFDIVWSPDNTQIAVSNVGSIEIWSEGTTTPAFSVQSVTIPLANSETTVRKLEWQGNLLAGQADFGKIHLWDTQTWQEIASFDGKDFSNALAVSPDGRRFAYAGVDGLLIIKSFPIATPGPNQTLTDTDDNGSELVILDGTASIDPDGTINTYEWLENGIIITQGENPQVELEVGEYTITLKVTDNDGLVDMAEVVVKVVAP